MFNLLGVAIIRKTGDQWCIFLKDEDKKLGCYKTKEEAIKRLRQIEYFKHAKSSFANENMDDLTMAILLDENGYSVCSTYRSTVADNSDEIHYISDGSVYYERGTDCADGQTREIFLIDDPMIEDPIQSYDNIFDNIDGAMEFAVTGGETERYYRFRQTDPSKYKEFRVVDISDGIRAILGIVKNGDKKKSEVQSYLFDKKKFTGEEAVKWLKNHGKKS